MSIANLIAKHICFGQAGYCILAIEFTCPLFHGASSLFAVIFLLAKSFVELGAKVTRHQSVFRLGMCYFARNFRAKLHILLVLNGMCNFARNF